MRSHDQARMGFTLLELVLSLAISSVLVLAVASSIMVAARSVPKLNDAATISTALGIVDDAIRSEIELATTIVSVDPRRLEIMITNRDGDEIEENIVFEWSGQAGDPLTRSVNSGVSIPLVAGVQQFISAVEYKPTGVFVGTSEAMPSSATINGEFTDGGWSPLNADRRLGIRVAPTGLGPTTQWRITRVDLLLRWRDPKEAMNVLIARVGRDVLDATDAWTYSYAEVLAGETSTDGQLKQLPLRTPWLAHDQPVIVSLHNPIANSTVDFYMRTIPMPQEMTWLNHVYDQCIIMSGASIGVRIAYETIVPPHIQEVQNTAHVVMLQMEFSTGVLPTTLRARPLARAEHEP